MSNPPKAMVVTCYFDFCVYNVGRKCSLDQISISLDGVCEMCIDKLKVDAAAKILDSRKQTATTYLKKR